MNVDVVQATYLFLLLVNMTNLEPDVLFSQRSRRVSDNILEALQSC